MKRIIALILVVVTLTLSLASCGYSMLDEDYGSYAEYNKEQLVAALANLEIEDGDFTSDAETRDQKVLDSIYEALAKEVDTKNEDLKVTTGVVGAHDLFYYCYYVTAIFKDGEADKEVTLYAANMNLSKVSNFQLGHSERGDVAELIENALKDYDLTDKAYTVTDKDKTATTEGKVAYVSYTQVVTDTEGKTKTTAFTNHRITLGEGDVGKALVGSTIGTAVADFKSEDGMTSYTSCKVDWVVETGEELTFKNTTFDTATTVKDTEGVSRNLKDVELTYHVYPVYYYQVEEYNVSSVLRTLISSLSKDALDCLADAEAEIKTFNEKLSAYETKKAAYETALKGEKSAKETYDNAKEAYDTENAKTEGKDEDKLAAYLETVNKTEEKYDAAKTETATKKTEMDTAKEELDTAETTLLGKVKVDEGKTAAQTVVAQHTKSTYDSLLESYNEELKALLAAEIYEVLKEKIVTTGAPPKAVQKTYDRLIESYEYTFYNSKYDSSESNYKHYNGNFKSFLMAKTGKTNYTDAKHAVWQEAVAHVNTIVLVYVAAEAFGQLAGEDEIKDYKNDEQGYYEAYVASYGELNTLAAFQFDKLMNHLLEYEANEESGEAEFKNVSFKIVEDSAEKE
jgi:hypothetical protein